MIDYLSSYIPIQRRKQINGEIVIHKDSIFIKSLCNENLKKSRNQFEIVYISNRVDIRPFYFENNELFEQIEEVTKQANKMISFTKDLETFKNDISKDKYKMTNYKQHSKEITKKIKEIDKLESVEEMRNEWNQFKLDNAEKFGLKE